MTQDCSRILNVSISHWAARFLAGEQVAPWQSTRPFPAVHPNDCGLGNGLAGETIGFRSTRYKNKHF